VKLATFSVRGQTKLGAIRGEEVVVFDSVDPSLPRSTEALLLAGPDAMAAVREALDRAPVGVPLADVRLLAPLRHPQKFLGIGFNMVSHVEELRAKGREVAVTEDQLWFNKQVSCITGPYDPIHLPKISKLLDYEIELGVVIGQRCRHVDAADARKVIAGYLVCNDASVRDWQRIAPALGKSFDTHGPIGPWLTTADEVPDPQSLWMRTWVDGELRQDGSTHEMIHGIDKMIAYLTAIFTLEPGDILCTGNPAGTGALRTPPQMLEAGQTVRMEIEGLGHIENPVIDEPLFETTYIG